MIKSLLVCLFLCTLNSAFGQFPIKITIAVTPPYPIYFSDFIGQAGTTVLIVQNTDLNNTHFIKFGGTIEGDNGIKVKLSPSYTPANALKLSPGEVRTLSGDDLRSLYPNISVDDFDYSGLKISQVIQSQRVPEGNYFGCIQAYDYFTGQKLSDDPPLGCTGILPYYSLDPPIITSPYNKQIVVAQNVQQLLFNWTNVAGAQTSISYRFRMVNVPKGINQYDAMLSDNLLVWEEDNIMAPVFLYGPDKPPLAVNTLYAIQVQAYDEAGQTLISNDGLSKIVLFYYKKGVFIPVPDPDSNPIDTTSNDPPIIVEEDNDEPLVVGNFNCGDDCTLVNVQDQTFGPPLLEGSQVYMGHFVLNLDQFTLSNNEYTGTGRIETSGFIDIPIRVSFQNLRINSDRKVYAGTARALHNADLIAVNWLNTNDEPEANNETTLRDIYDALIDPVGSISTFIDDLPEVDVNVGVSLPLAYGTSTYDIHIVGMNFTSQGATVNMMAGVEINGDYQNGKKHLILYNNNVCFMPGGVETSQGNSLLGLLAPFDYATSNKYRMHFEVGIPTDQRGTYATYDCDGIQDIHVGGFVDFDRNFIKPVNSSNQLFSTGLMAAEFQSSFQNGFDWVTELSFQNAINRNGFRFTNKFEFKGLEGHIFEIEDLLIDNSIVTNPVNATFPTGLNNIGPSWQGVYIRNLSLKLPNFMKKDNAPIKFSAQNLVIDASGLSGRIMANNLMTLDQGDIGGWDFSMTNFDLRIANNSINRARFIGGIKLPITATPLNYSTDIQFSNNHTIYDFNISTGNNIQVPMWGAKINIDNSSTIGLEIQNGEVEFYTNINGNLSLNNSIGDFNGINIQNLDFTNLSLSNKPPYIDNMEFDLNPGASLKFLNFDVGLNDITIIKPQNVTSSANALFPLQFDLDFSFGEGANSFGGGTVFRLNAKKLANSQDWTLNNVEIEQINFNAEISAVKINGSVNFFKNDPVFGKGFRGGLTADMMGKFSLDAEALFGTKSNYDYWYVSGNAKFPETIPLAPGIGLNGLGGGAFYNMIPTNTLSIRNIGGNAMTRYNPSRGGWGFKAMVCFATMPLETLATGDMTLEAAFSNSGSLHSISLDGNAWLMREPTVTNGIQSGNGNNASVQLAGTLSYDHINSILDGSLGYKLSVPPSNPILNVDRLTNRVIRFHFGGANDWFVHLGKPNIYGTFDDMIALEVDKRIKILGKSVALHYGLYSYFDIGTNTPPFPPLPLLVRQRLGYSNNFAQPLGNPSFGVATGFHADFRIPRTRFKYRALRTNWGIYFDADAGYGFDLVLRRNQGLLCNGDPKFGINNFYAQGQGYIYGGANFGATIFSRDVGVGANFAAAVNAEMPNPTFIKGTIAATVDMYFFDLRFRKGFSIGTKCALTENEDANNDMVIGHIQSLSMIKSFTKPETSGYVDFSDPAYAAIVDFHIPPGEIFNASYGSTTMYYKTILNYELKERNTSGSYVKIADQDDMRNTLIQKNMVIHINDFTTRNLNPNKYYKFKLTADLWYKTSENGSWVMVRNENNQYISETKEFRFRTSSASSKITNVVNQIPRAQLNYYHQGDHTNTYIMHTNTGVFDRFGNNPYVALKFYKNFHEDPITVPATIDGGTLYAYVRYNLPNLSPETKYKVQVVAASSGNEDNLSIVYTFYFGTSKYSKLKDKIEDLELSFINGFSPTNSNESTTHYRVSLRGPEAFEEVEVQWLDPSVYPTLQNSPWYVYRRRLIQLAEQYGLDHENFMDELSLSSSFNYYTPPLDLRSAGVASNLQNLASNLGYSSVASLAENFNIEDIINLNPVNLTLVENPLNIRLELLWKPNQFLNGIRANVGLLMLVNGNNSGPNWQFVIQPIVPFIPAGIHTIKFVGDEMDNLEAYLNIQ